MTLGANGEFGHQQGIIGPGQGIYEASATAQHRLGTRIQLGERVFYYALAGAANLAAGILVESVSATQINKSVAAAVAVGGYDVTLTTSAAVTTEGIEGYLQINDAAGEGIQYRIKNCVANASTSTSTDVTLYDPIVTALTTDSQATIVPNPWYNVVVCDATADVACGVPPIPVTATYYFWCQTWGPAPILCEGEPAEGSVVEVAAGVSAGGVSNCNADTAFGVGTMMLVGVTTEYKPVFLRISC